MKRTLGRLAFPAAVLVLVIGICVVGGFLVVVALPDMANSAAVSSASPSGATANGSGASASEGPSPAPTSAMALSPIGIAMPEGADCNACHTTTSGQIGVKDIPYLGHALKGFADCTACHNPTGLVKTAPGHDSLHKNECLACHQENPALANQTGAPMRPEHMGAQGMACTECHGMDEHAPLPSDMVGRGNNCWICHNGPEFAGLFASSSPGTEGGGLSPTPTPAASPSPTVQPPSGYILNPPSPPVN